MSYFSRFQPFFYLTKSVINNTPYYIYNNKLEKIVYDEKEDKTLAQSNRFKRAVYRAGSELADKWEIPKPFSFSQGVLSIKL